MGRRKYRWMLHMSMVLMLLGSLCLLMIPSTTAEKMEQGHSQLLLLMAGAFWLTTVLAYVFLFLFSRKRKKSDPKQEKTGIARWGLLRFFSNRPAMLADLLMLASLVAFVVLELLSVEGMAVYVIFASFVLFLQLHGLLNGVNYRWLHRGGRYQRTDKKSKAV